MNREPERVGDVVARVFGDIERAYSERHGAHMRELIGQEKGADEMIRIREFAPEEIADILKSWIVAGAAPVLVRGADGRLVVRFAGISRVIADCLHPSRELWTNVRYWLGREEADAVVSRVVSYFFPSGGDKADYARRILGIIDALEISDAEISMDVVKRVVRIEAAAASLHGLDLRKG